jgi:hypothetical protein
MQNEASQVTERAAPPKSLIPNKKRATFAFLPLRGEPHQLHEQPQEDQNGNSSPVKVKPDRVHQEKQQLWHQNPLARRRSSKTNSTTTQSSKSSKSTKIQIPVVPADKTGTECQRKWWDGDFMFPSVKPGVPVPVPADDKMQSGPPVPSVIVVSTNYHDTNYPGSAIRSSSSNDINSQQW